MSSISLIPSDRNLISEIVPMLVRRERDYSGNIVVFPGKRPAHALRKALAREAHGSYLPPKIFSMDHFIEFLCGEKLMLPRISLESLDAVALLHELYLTDNNRPGGAHFTSLAAFLPLGMKLFGELEELWIADIPLLKIREVLSGISITGLPSLPLLYEKFYAIAAERNLATRSMKYRYAAEKAAEIDFSAYGKIVFGGFFALTKSETILLKHVATLENAALIFQNGVGIGLRLEKLGFTPPAPAQAPTEPSIHLYRSADAHGQVFALSRNIEEMIQRSPSSIEKTAVVLPAAENLFPVFHQTLALLEDDQYNITLGYPVTRTPVYGFLQSLMELMISTSGDRFSVSHYLKFILHPYTKNIRCGKRSDVTRILFNTIEDYFRREYAGGHISLEELERNPLLFDRASKRIAGAGEAVSADKLREHLISIHTQTIRVFTSIETIGTFAEGMASVLRYIGAESTAQLHPFFRPFAQTLVNSLGEISSSLLRDRPLDAAVDYVSFLRNYLTSIEVPFTGTPLHGLQVLGFLETRSLQFDTVFILDVNDDVLPGNKGQDVLLPTKVRESLGLTTYRDSERVAEYYFDLLLHGARDVHIFFAQEGRKERSRFVEKLLWDREQRGGLKDPKEQIQTIQYQVQLSNPTPSAVPKSSEVAAFLRGFTYNATALDTYLRCQLRFYYTYVMRLQERDEIADEVDQADIGVFIHSVLASFFGRLKGQELTRENLNLEVLQRIIDETAARRFGDTSAGSAYLMIHQVKKHLADIIENYQRQMLDRKIVLDDLEVKLEATFDKFQIAGKLDRVEERGGTVYILDYKTGGSEKHVRINFNKLNLEDRESWNNYIGSLQLPIYTILHARATGTSIEKIVSAYLFIGRDEIDPTIEVPLFGDENAVGEKFGILEEIIKRLLREIADSGHAFKPTSHIERDCRECSFKYICGTQWVG